MLGHEARGAASFRSSPQKDSRGATSWASSAAGAATRLPESRALPGAGTADTVIAVLNLLAMGPLSARLLMQRGRPKSDRLGKIRSLE